MRLEHSGERGLAQDDDPVPRELDGPLLLQGLKGPADHLAGGADDVRKLLLGELLLQAKIAASIVLGQLQEELGYPVGHASKRQVFNLLREEAELSCKHLEKADGDRRVFLY